MKKGRCATLHRPPHIALAMALLNAVGDGPRSRKSNCFIAIVTQIFRPRIQITRQLLKRRPVYGRSRDPIRLNAFCFSRKGLSAHLTKRSTGRQNGKWL